MCYHDVAAPGWAPCALAGQVVQMQKCENKATKSREIKDILWWRGFATVAAASGTPTRMARRSPEERVTSAHAVSPAAGTPKVQKQTHFEHRDKWSRERRAKDLGKRGGPKTNPLRQSAVDRGNDETKPNNRGESGALASAALAAGTPLPDSAPLPEERIGAPSVAHARRRGAMKVQKQTHFAAFPMRSDAPDSTYRRGVGR